MSEVTQPLGGIVPFERTATVVQIVETIREALVAGALPGGARLTEQQLAQQLGVSRGPVREALQRLVQEGLLIGRPHRGVVVPVFDRESVRDIYLARLAVERTAAVVLTRRCSAATVERLGAAVGAMRADIASATPSWTALADHDLEFHRLFVAGAASPRLLRLFQTLSDETRMVMAHVGVVYAEPARLVEEHAALLAALRERDAEALVARVESHLQWSLEAVPADLLDGAGPADPRPDTT
jgi:DNA-binding GntR family transcriptional regulator